MTTCRACLLWVVAASIASAASAAEPVHLSCVLTQGEARYRNMGYDHIVHVQNHCDKNVVCDVSTDVNPEPEHVAVASGAEVDVLTFRGSPAREFTVRADCRYP
jgi:hypothetical protein